MTTRVKVVLVVLGVLGAAALATIIVILLTARTPEAALVAAKPSPTAAPTASSPSPTPVPTVTSTTPAVAPAEPAPAAPAAPAPAAPAAPAPPAPAPAQPPVIPPLSVDDMYAYPSGTCGTTGPIVVGWSASGALLDSASLQVKTGGGTPIFNQTWEGYNPIDEISLNIDCTRALWYFKLTVSSATGSRTALLTFANGQSQGWSSVAP